MSSINTERLQQAFQRLEVFPERNAALDQSFRDLILNGNDDILNRINAHDLAKRWTVPHRQVLTWLLYAGHVGLFDLNWESYCPHCGGMQAQGHRPGELGSHGTCVGCVKNFDLHLDDNVEVTFNISPQVRQTKPSLRVFAPKNTVEVGQFKTDQPITITVQATRPYAVLNPSGTLVAILHVQADHEYIPELHIAYDAKESNAPQYYVGEGQITLHISNIGEVLIGYRDNDLPKPPVVNGLEMAMVPAFQKLFSQDVLSQRESLTIRNLTILFTDITGSTALYQRLGDVRAYNLVRDHFEVLFREIEKLNGTVVKTIGDAVMAAFSTPEAALQAGLEVQRAIREFNEGRRYEDGMILVKIGLHMGSAIAVNLNERLDYFGNMVNLAARIQGQSRSAEILVSQEVYQDASVQAMLKSQPNIRISESMFELAGIEQAQQLYSIAHAAKWN